MDPRLKSLLGRGSYIIDLGCGSGQLLEGVADIFERRIGLDISRQRLKERGVREPSGWQFISADLNGRFPIEGNIADAVVANQVIEHVLDPVRFVKEIRRILRPGGRCVITTPNIRYIKHISSLVFSGYGPKTAGGNTIDGDWDDGHLHYFTHRDMRELFIGVGFVEVRSQALIDIEAGGIRKLFHMAAESKPVREFLSGNILLWAKK